MIYEFINFDPPIERPDWILPSERQAQEVSLHRTAHESDVFEWNQDPEYVREILSYIDPDEDRNDIWVNGLMAIHHHYDGSEIGEDAAHEWSITGFDPSGQEKPLYVEKDFHRTWASIKGRENPVTFATICRLAKERGANLSEINKRYRMKFNKENATDQLTAIQPDMTLLDPEKSQAPVLSADEWNYILGSDWYKIIDQAARSKNAPIDYVVLNLLSVVSATIGNARWVKIHTDWQEPPAIWAMTIGTPSASKSPAMDAVIKPLDTIQQEYIQKYRQDKQLWDDQKQVAEIAEKHWKSKVTEAIKNGAAEPEKPKQMKLGDKPLLPRIKVTDSTIEKLAELNRDNFRGLLLAMDELSGLLGNMSRYSNGTDQPYFLVSYGGRAHSVDRKSHEEPIIVSHLLHSILGGIQPDRFDQFILGEANDGFAARFIAAYPDPVPLTKFTGNSVSGQIERAYRKILDMPLAIDEHGNPQVSYLELSDEARDFHFECHQKFNAWSDAATGLLQAHYGKFAGMLARIALVLEYLNYAIAEHVRDEPARVSMDSMKRAMKLIETFVKPHAERVYKLGSLPAEEQGAMKIARYIVETGITEFTVREICQRKWKHPAGANEVRAAINVLIQAGWVTWIESDSRKQQVCAVNPKVHQGEAPKLAA